jgi:uncharacterized protein YecT (DUF1311 family)
MRRGSSPRISCARSTVALGIDAGTLVHQLRLGVKGGKFNVLGRKLGKPASFSMGFLARIIAIASVLIGIPLPQFAAVAKAAEGDAVVDSPLAHCWKQASTRVALAPCLEGLLRDAQGRLEMARLQVEGEAAELDRVTGNRSKNAERTRVSAERWRAYRDAECDRQAEAMSPGTGSGDILLACRITLTNERVKQLGMP